MLSNTNNVFGRMVLIVIFPACFYLSIKFLGFLFEVGWNSVLLKKLFVVAISSMVYGVIASKMIK